MTKSAFLIQEVGCTEEAEIRGFLKECELRRLSPETIEGYKSSLKISSQILRKAGLTLNKLDKKSLKVILQNLVKRGYVYNTLLQYFAALSGYYNYLIWEEIVQTNPVVPFRKRYVRKYKSQQAPERKLISVDEMAMLINSILTPRDRAIVTLLALNFVRSYLTSATI